MEHEDSEAAAAAALLLIVEQSYKDLEKAGNDVQRVKARSDSLVERTSAQRSRDAMSSANAQEGVKVRKAGSRQKLSKTSQAILVAWLEAHTENPYPTKQEKDDLAREAGLTVKQVSDFAGNWRKRKWKAPVGLDQLLDEEDVGGEMDLSD